MTPTAMLIYVSTRLLDPNNLQLGIKIRHYEQRDVVDVTIVAVVGLPAGQSRERLCHYSKNQALTYLYRNAAVARERERMVGCISDSRLSFLLLLFS